MPNDLVTVRRWSERISELTVAAVVLPSSITPLQERELAGLQERLLSDFRVVIHSAHLGRDSQALVEEVNAILRTTLSAPHIAALSDYRVFDGRVTPGVEEHFPGAWLDAELAVARSSKDVMPVEALAAIVVKFFAECRRRVRVINAWIEAENRAMVDKRKREMPSAAGPIWSINALADKLVTEGCLTPEEFQWIQALMHEAADRLQGYFPPLRSKIPISYNRLLGRALMDVMASAGFQERNSAMSWERAAHYSVGFASCGGFALRASTLRRLTKP